ncbi:MAG: hypothetical protein ACXWMJ_08045 [Syntrophales bacterium]
MSIDDVPGEDCMGWIRENCFVYLSLPVADSDKHIQTELDWSKYEPSKSTEENSSERSDHQLTFFDELEKLITQKHSEHKKLE